MHVKLACKPEHLRHFDQRYCDIFREVFEERYHEEYENQLLTYESRSLDSATAALMQSHGGFLLCTRNLEGDILSEVVENGMSSQGLMINESRGSQGEYLLESNHGPLTRHF